MLRLIALCVHAAGTSIIINPIHPPYRPTLTGVEKLRRWGKTGLVVVGAYLLLANTKGVLRAEVRDGAVVATMAR